MKITRECPLFRQASKYENTNFPVWQSRAPVELQRSSIGVQLGINRRMLYSDAKMCLYMYMFLIFK